MKLIGISPSLNGNPITEIKCGVNPFQSIIQTRIRTVTFVHFTGYFRAHESNVVSSSLRRNVASPSLIQARTFHAFVAVRQREASKGMEASA